MKSILGIKNIFATITPDVLIALEIARAQEDLITATRNRIHFENLERELNQRIDAMLTLREQFQNKEEQE